jgi:hypothetical protein
MRKRNAVVLALVAIIGCAARAHCAEIVAFDSHTAPPLFGGFSSPDTGVATQLSVTQQLMISRMGVLNEMLSAGQLKFVIMSYPQPQFLYVSAPEAFGKDTAGQETWKQSDPFSFTFDPGKTYLVGYLQSVAVNEDVDGHAESASGITSDLFVHALSSFSNPTYSHLFLTGGDESVRLYTVPEPAITPLLAPSLMLLTRRRPKR